MRVSDAKINRIKQFARICIAAALIFSFSPSFVYAAKTSDKAVAEASDETAAEASDETAGEESDMPVTEESDEAASETSGGISSEVSDAPRDRVDEFLSESAFIGNSVSEGLALYNSAKKKEPLGDAVMLARVSYSFYSDRVLYSNFLPRLDGVPMRAKDAVKNCGAQNVFICMGTNDLVGSSAVETAVLNYQEFIKEILDENPGVTVFIESCTPTRPGSNVSNEKVKAFNSYMRSYSDLLPNVFYVDIATPLSDEMGHLMQSLSSDGSVHLTYEAYRIWTDTIRHYIADLLEKRRKEQREKDEILREISRKNYEADMRRMHTLKEKDRQIRLTALREAQRAEEEKRKNEMLNVPDEVTLMRIFASNERSKYSAVSDSLVKTPFLGR